VSTTGASEKLAEAITALVSEALSKIDIPTAGEEWRLLTAAEAAERLGRSPSWLRERTARGDIPWVRLDAGPRMYRAEDLAAYAAAHVIPGERLKPLEADRPSRTRNGAPQPPRFRVKE
jgi:hypothetical protein